ncbi:hypothetical protein B0H17DRAFT_1155326 [Mycena rosella]|uniref:Uncharacterized protein n=1 Tax=Mycena rosella TaxID=1033263 RepID=A0AAD7AWE3_MYCRO|nr:hypothetical protein B0H17DRAFT_1155326 [Mycena rosella]
MAKIYRGSTGQVVIGNIINNTKILFKSKRRKAVAKGGEFYAAESVRYEGASGRVGRRAGAVQYGKRALWEAAARGRYGRGGHRQRISRERFVRYSSEDVAHAVAHGAVRLARVQAARARYGGAIRAAGGYGWPNWTVTRTDSALLRAAYRDSGAKCCRAVPGPEE